MNLKWEGRTEEVPEAPVERENILERRRDVYSLRGSQEYCMSLALGAGVVELVARPRGGERTYLRTGVGGQGKREHQVIVLTDPKDLSTTNVPTDRDNL